MGGKIERPKWMKEEKHRKIKVKEDKRQVLVSKASA